MQQALRRQHFYERREAWMGSLWGKRRHFVSDCIFGSEFCDFGGDVSGTDWRGGCSVKAKGSRRRSFSA